MSLRASVFLLIFIEPSRKNVDRNPAPVSQFKPRAAAAADRLFRSSVRFAQAVAAYLGGVLLRSSVRFAALSGVII